MSQTSANMVRGQPNGESTSEKIPECWNIWNLTESSWHAWYIPYGYQFLISQLLVSSNRKKRAHSTSKGAWNISKSKASSMACNPWPPFNLVVQYPGSKLGPEYSKSCLYKRPKRSFFTFAKWYSFRTCL